MFAVLSWNRLDVCFCPRMGLFLLHAALHLPWECTLTTFAFGTFFIGYLCFFWSHVGNVNPLRPLVIGLWKSHRPLVFSSSTEFYVQTIAT